MKTALSANERIFNMGDLLNSHDGNQRMKTTTEKPEFPLKDREPRILVGRYIQCHVHAILVNAGVCFGMCM